MDISIGMWVALGKLVVSLICPLERPDGQIFSSLKLRPSVRKGQPLRDSTRRVLQPVSELLFDFWRALGSSPDSSVNGMV